MRKRLQQFLCKLGVHKYTTLANGPTYKWCKPCSHNTFNGNTPSEEWNEHFDAVGPTQGKCGNDCRYCCRHEG